MPLIINDKIQELMKGYPTVSDKYNVAGAVLAGTTPVEFGDLVQFSGTKGYFEAVTASKQITAASQLAGFVVATNVKLATEWPGETVAVRPGEAFNLLINGFIAVECVSTAKPAEITANASVYVTANGKVTTATDTAKVVAIPNCVFTGVYENHGTTSAPKYYAEIYVK